MTSLATRHLHVADSFALKQVGWNENIYAGGCLKKCADEAFCPDQAMNGRSDLRTVWSAVNSNITSSWRSIWSFLEAVFGSIYTSGFCSLLLLLLFASVEAYPSRSLLDTFFQPLPLPLPTTTTDLIHIITWAKFYFIENRNTHKHIRLSVKSRRSLLPACLLACLSQSKGNFFEASLRNSMWNSACCWFWNFFGYGRASGRKMEESQKWVYREPFFLFLFLAFLLGWKDLNMPSLALEKIACSLLEVFLVKWMVCKEKERAKFHSALKDLT